MKAISGAAALAAAFFCATADAFWRLPCDAPILVERADPIVNPGKVSGHLHTIMGGNGFGFTMDYKQAIKSNCSSCAVTQDLSNYWTPTLFFKAENGSFHPVQQLGGALVYYLQRRATPAEKLYAFPPGFRMLAGDPSLRSYTDTKEQKAISYACIDYRKASPEIPGFPTKNCPNGLRSQVFFPSCWDGKNLDSPDHKSHVAYPSGVNNGACPSTHPVRLISIFYEVLWDVNPWKNMWPKGKWPFVFSNGDPTGYGFHGDFVNGWDQHVLQLAVDNCNDDSGQIEKCPYFKFFDKEVQNDCMVPPRIKEQTTGWLDKLPGCNTVTYGPAKAKPVTGCGSTTEIGQPQRYDSDVSSKGWEYVGCALDFLDDRTLPDRTYSADMTVEKCIEYCISKGQVIAGLEYGNECWCGSSIKKSRLGYRKCLMPCAGNPSQFCGDGLRLSVYKKSPPNAVTHKVSTKTPQPTAKPTPTARPAVINTSSKPKVSVPKAKARRRRLPSQYVRGLQA